VNCFYILLHVVLRVVGLHATIKEILPSTATLGTDVSQLPAKNPSSWF